MSILPYNPYFDGPAAPFAGVGPYHPYAWHQGHPFYAPSLAWHPFAMLRAAEQQLWHQHRQVVGPTQQQAIMPNGEFNYNMNAIGYKPDELGIDINGNEVVISGQHRTDAKQRNQPSGHHQFYRRFTLPSGVRPDSLKCDVDERGNLAITGKVDPNFLAIENGGEGHHSERSSGRRTPIPIRYGGSNGGSRESSHDGLYRGQPAISY